MIKTLPLIALAAFVMAPVSMAAASDGAKQTSAASSATIEDFSAAKKKKAKTGVRVYPNGYYAYPPRAAYGWRGLDPVLPPNPEVAWRRSIGQCVVDLGYGRWETCDGPSMR
jgi:hypothetical protein